MTKSSKPIAVFDLGGVLVDLASPAESMGLDMDHETFWSLWSTLPDVRAWETGACTTEDFFESLASHLGVADAEEMAQRYARWELLHYPGALDLLRTVIGQCRVGLLSNVNPVHWQYQTTLSDVYDSFDHLFLSFETGVYKPDEDAFQQLIQVFDCEPDDIVFFDDSLPNIESARRFGLRAYQTQGVDATRPWLRELFGIAC